MNSLTLLWLAIAASFAALAIFRKKEILYFLLFLAMCFHQEIFFELVSEGASFQIFKFNWIAISPYPLSFSFVFRVDLFSIFFSFLLVLLFTLQLKRSYFDITIFTLLAVASFLVVYSNNAFTWIFLYSSYFILSIILFYSFEKTVSRWLFNFILWRFVGLALLVSGMMISGLTSSSEMIVGASRKEAIISYFLLFFGCALVMGAHGFFSFLFHRLKVPAAQRYFFEFLAPAFFVFKFLIVILPPSSERIFSLLFPAVILLVPALIYIITGLIINNFEYKLKSLYLSGALIFILFYLFFGNVFSVFLFCTLSFCVFIFYFIYSSLKVSSAKLTFYHRTKAVFFAYIPASSVLGFWGFVSFSFYFFTLRHALSVSQAALIATGSALAGLFLLLAQIARDVQKMALKKDLALKKYFVLFLPLVVLLGLFFVSALEHGVFFEQTVGARYYLDPFYAFYNEGPLSEEKTYKLLGGFLVFQLIFFVLGSFLSSEKLCSSSFKSRILFQIEGCWRLFKRVVAQADERLKALCRAVSAAKTRNLLTAEKGRIFFEKKIENIKVSGNSIVSGIRRRQASFDKIVSQGLFWIHEADVQNYLIFVVIVFLFVYLGGVRS